MQLRDCIDISAVVRRNRSYGSEEWVVVAETHSNCQDWRQAIFAGSGPSLLNKHVSRRQRNTSALRGHECAENCKNSISLPYAECQFIDAQTVAAAGAECTNRLQV